MNNSKKNKTKPSCEDEFDPNALSVEQANASIDRLAMPIAEQESLAISDILGRVLAEDVQSQVNVPNYTNSAMDGYAVNFKDIQHKDHNELFVSATILAGDTSNVAIKPGECARIMTGAKMPSGADSVIMQEQVERNNTHVILLNAIIRGQNVRQIGEDINIDDVILKSGHVIDVADIGLLASIGVSHTLLTRNELVALGTELKQGQLYDSNRYTLNSMLQSFGADLIDMGVIRDDQNSIETALHEASKIADVIITTGGVSVGDADFVKSSLENIGEVDFWKIAMKPGRPLAFGRINHSLFFGLPGNPVSTMVTFYQFVLPALRKLSGQSRRETLSLKATTVSKLTKRKGRRDFQRGVLSMDASGNMQVKSTGMQGSHILSSMSTANCFIVLDEECEIVDAGASVQVQPFSSFF